MKYKRSQLPNANKQNIEESDNGLSHKRIFTALFTTAQTVSNRNPQSRGQGLSGESKVAILQLLQNENKH